jgi:small subunit ribosomal protein S7
MSRRKIITKNFPVTDSIYNSYLVNLLLARIITKGKKSLAQKIIHDSFTLIQYKTNLNPVESFEEAIRQVTPSVEVKSRRIGGANYQVPVEVKPFRGTILALRWILQAAKKRQGNTFSVNLANEIIDSSKGSSESIKKKIETHRMAKANKVFSHFQY